MAAGAFAAEQKWTVSGAFSTTTGSYGTENEIRTVTSATVIEREFDWGNLEVTLPYERITAPEGTTVIEGTPTPPENNPVTGTPTSGPGRGRRGRTRTLAVTSTTTATEEQQVVTTGLGDIKVGGTLDLRQESAWLPSAALSAEVKIPTANEDKGLGTGKFDETVGATFIKSIGAPWSVDVGGKYSVLGSPDGFDYRNTWGYQIGLSCKATPEATIHFFYADALNAVRGQPNLRELHIEGSYIRQRVVLAAEAEAGLTDSTEDWGFGLKAGIKI